MDDPAWKAKSRFKQESGDGGNKRPEEGDQQEGACKNAIEPDMAL